MNSKSVDDPDREPFCETAFARRLLNSERFAYHEDNEADVCLQGFEIVRKEKRLLEKLVGGKRSEQAFIEYIGRKR